MSVEREGQDGRVLAGKYRLERPLAKGGKGAVWAARHLQLGVEVAVKFMASGLVQPEESRRGFELGAKAAAMLKSPHLVQVHDYGIEAGTPYIVMELLPGEDLAARLARVGRLEPAMTAKLVVQACKALRKAHEAGLVHGDLRPSNIYLERHDDEDVIKILDLGISKDLALLQTQAQMSPPSHDRVSGALHYLAPEQVMDGWGVDARADLWALGAIAFECLTGQRPFPEARLGERFEPIGSPPPLIASRLAPDLGAGVDPFFARALACDPEHRYPTAQAFAEAFVSLDWSAEGKAEAPAPLPAEDPEALEQWLSGALPSWPSAPPSSAPAAPIEQEEHAETSSPEPIEPEESEALNSALQARRRRVGWFLVASLAAAGSLLGGLIAHQHITITHAPKAPASSAVTTMSRDIPEQPSATAQSATAQSATAQSATAQSATAQSAGVDAAAPAASPASPQDVSAARRGADHDPHLDRETSPSPLVPSSETPQHANGALRQDTAKAPHGAPPAWARSKAQPWKSLDDDPYSAPPPTARRSIKRAVSGDDPYEDHR